jgi:hypothetical protein
LVVLPVVVDDELMPSPPAPTDVMRLRFGLRRGDLLAFRSQHAEERADLELALGGVSHGRVRVHDVPVTSPDPLASHVTSVDEIPDDSLRRALRHTHHLGYVAQARVGVVLDAQENL